MGTSLGSRITGYGGGLDVWGVLHHQVEDGERERSVG